MRIAKECCLGEVAVFVEFLVDLLYACVFIYYIWAGVVSLVEWDDPEISIRMEIESQLDLSVVENKITNSLGFWLGECVFTTI